MNSSRSSLRDVSASAQCRRLVERLRVGSINSFEIIEELNICRPGARISDLRADGYVIHTRLADLIDAQGFKHPRVATYTLIAEPVEKAAAA
ncbi:helix-turn-helix domain-containing protein [Stutzerimonas nitrititolerans]|uniref:helix-turn-helix domain-containing protein n=1 Tax=Stutzerimonas nitrititolerans TaxID=2482751 RepID=UPI00289FCB76|nr:helix-turn-helix domain-containing protein [Stutzerimonas nitrititolerans]